MTRRWLETSRRSTTSASRSWVVTWSDLWRVSAALIATSASTVSVISAISTAIAVESRTAIATFHWGVLWAGTETRWWLAVAFYWQTGELIRLHHKVLELWGISKFRGTVRHWWKWDFVELDGLVARLCVLLDGPTVAILLLLLTLFVAWNGEN